MVKELTVTVLSLVMFFFLVFVGQLKGILFGLQDVPQKKQVTAGSCPQMKNALKGTDGWEADR